MAVSGCQRGRQTAILASGNLCGQVDGHFFDEDCHGNGSCARLDPAFARARNIALPPVTEIAIDAGAQSADNLRTSTPPKEQHREAGTGGIEDRCIRKMNCAAKAIRTAAQRTAKPFFSGARDICTLEPGKHADLIVIKGNLAADRKALKNLQWTVKAGVAYDSPRILAAMKGKVGLH
jgi:hypothetical protein